MIEEKMNFLFVPYQWFEWALTSEWDSLDSCTTVYIAYILGKSKRQKHKNSDFSLCDHYVQLITSLPETNTLTILQLSPTDIEINLLRLTDKQYEISSSY